jgi:hypothetical protein
MLPALRIFMDFIRGLLEVSVGAVISTAESGLTAAPETWGKAPQRGFG